jgi:hypothetical protein
MSQIRQALLLLLLLLLQRRRRPEEAHDGCPVFVCLYLNLFNDFFQLDEKEEEEEAGYSGSNVDGWKEVFKRWDRQTDIIEEEEEDASTFSVDLEKPRQKRRKKKTIKRSQLLARAF